MRDRVKRILGFVLVATVMGPPRSPRQTENALAAAIGVRRPLPMAALQHFIPRGWPAWPWGLKPEEPPKITDRQSALATSTAAQTPSLPASRDIQEAARRDALAISDCDIDGVPSEMKRIRLLLAAADSRASRSEAMRTPSARHPSVDVTQRLPTKDVLVVHFETQFFHDQRQLVRVDGVETQVFLDSGILVEVRSFTIRLPAHMA